MTRIIVFLFASLLVETAGAVQRLADIRPGIPCDRIPGVEERLGSLQLDAQDAGGVRRYEGTHGGFAATVVYRCDGEALVEQEIIITSHTRDDAHRIANYLNDELAKSLGRPLHDGLNLSAWRKMMFGVLGADLDYLTSVVVWGRTKEDVMLSVSESGDGLWTVTISQGGSKMEYILNS